MVRVGSNWVGSELFDEIVKYEDKSMTWSSILLKMFLGLCVYSIDLYV